MGVLNVTPDSFSDGGQFLDPDQAVVRAAVMAREGAVLIDVGGASSRPKGTTYGKGADLVSADEECSRILPVIKRIADRLPEVWISVDTFRSDVARAALDAGAHMINDITALRFDLNLARVAGEADAPLVLMHSVGMPGMMPHVAPSDSILEDVREALAMALEQAREAGCRQLVVDPGFGFGKTTVDNLRLMGGVEQLLTLGHPVLIGVSRKSSIARAAAGENAERDELPPPEDRLPGSLAATGVAVKHGASIVRTHDVAATRQFLNVLDATIRASNGQN
jgi:dihydropteroate synthase